MKDLPFGCTPLVISYLEAGLRIPNRDDAHRHTAMILGCLNYVYVKLYV